MLPQDGYMNIALEQTEAYENGQVGGALGLLDLAPRCRVVPGSRERRLLAPRYRVAAPTALLCPAGDVIATPRACLPCS